MVIKLKKKLTEILEWAKKITDHDGKLIENICIAIKSLLSRSREDVFPFFNKPLVTFLGLRKISEYIDQWISYPQIKNISRKKLSAIKKMIDGLINQKELKKLAIRLSLYQKIVDELRELLEPKKNDTSLKVKDRILLFINRLIPLFTYYPDLQKIKDRLEKYWDNLFHTYDIPGLHRVNNGAENFNLLLKRINRKWTGRKDNWLFIEHYGPSIAYFPNFSPTNEKDPRSPLEKLGVFSHEEIINLFTNVSKSDMKSINDSIKNTTEGHKITLKILKNGIDWFLKDTLNEWLKINKNNNIGDYS